MSTFFLEISWRNFYLCRKFPTYITNNTYIICIYIGRYLCNIIMIRMTFFLSRTVTVIPLWYRNNAVIVLWIRSAGLVKRYHRYPSAFTIGSVRLSDNWPNRTGVSHVTTIWSPGRLVNNAFHNNVVRISQLNGTVWRKKKKNWILSKTEFIHFEQTN